jgi:hypothetical protein
LSQGFDMIVLYLDGVSGGIADLRWMVATPRQKTRKTRPICRGIAISADVFAGGTHCSVGGKAVQPKPRGYASNARPPAANIGQALDA